MKRKKSKYFFLKRSVEQIAATNSLPPLQLVLCVKALPVAHSSAGKPVQIPAQHSAHH